MNSYSVGLKRQIWGGGIEGVGLLNSLQKKEKKNRNKNKFCSCDYLRTWQFEEICSLKKGWNTTGPLSQLTLPFHPLAACSV